MAAVLVDEAEFGNIVSHTRELVSYLQPHPVLIEAAFHAMGSLSRPTSWEIHDALQVQSQLLERYCLPCLRYAWQASRRDHFLDPVSDRSDDSKDNRQIMSE